MEACLVASQAQKFYKRFGHFKKFLKTLFYEGDIDVRVTLGCIKGIKSWTCTSKDCRQRIGEFFFALFKKLSQSVCGHFIWDGLRGILIFQALPDLIDLNWQGVLS